jgi:hypothetical protein
VSFVCGSSFVAHDSFPLCITCIWHGICNMMYRHPCILVCMHFVSYALVRKSFSYIVHHGMIFMSLWACLVSYSLFGLALDNLGLYPWLMAMFLKNVIFMLSCE